MSNSTGITPRDIAVALARHWTGEITNVEIAEDMLGWSVRVTVQPPDKRKRPITWAECGETRDEAIAEALECGAFAWPSIHGMLPTKRQRAST